MFNMQLHAFSLMRKPLCFYHSRLWETKAKMQNTPELIWLIAIALITATMWMPHAIENVLLVGLKRALSNPPVTDPNVPAWAIRSKRAHLNALENLAVFAPVVIAAVLMGTTGGTVLLAVKVYVFARVIHYIVYTAGIPVARTLSFVTGASAIGVS